MANPLLKNRDGTVSPPWRTLALLLDVLILGTPIALLAVAGSFGSEATHRQPDPAYLWAGGIALCYALAEGIWGVTPGLLIVGARINPSSGENGPKSRALRWAIKYGPFVVPYLVAVAAFSTGDLISMLSGVAALGIWLCAGVVLIVSLVKHVVSRGRSPLYFDELAKTRVEFTRRREGATV